MKESEIEDFGKGDVNLKIPVPRDVKDGRQWGRALMQLPALKSRNLSYEEIFDLVVVEEDADITKYRWVMETHGKTVTDAPRTRAEDFAMYLRYRKADEIMGTGKLQRKAKVHVVNTTCENGAVASKTHAICCSLRLDLISSTTKWQSVAHGFSKRNE